MGNVCGTLLLEFFETWWLVAFGDWRSVYGMVWKEVYFLHSVLAVLIFLVMCAYITQKQNL